MLSLKRFSTGFTGLTIAFALSACGFQPIAATQSDGRLNGRPKLSSLNVDSDESRFVYHFRRRLIQSVDIGVSGAPRFETRTTFTRTALAISETDDITRFTFRTRTSYSLKTTSDQVVTSGVTSTATSVNATASQFTTEISERDALKRIAEETADRLINILRLHQK